MKFLFTFGVLFIVCTASAQIVITRPDFGDTGDTVRYSQSNDLMVDYSTTGPNQTWDFSDLVAGDQYLKRFSAISEAGPLATVSFGQFAPPQYKGNYFTEANQLPLDQLGGLLPISISGIYQVTRLTDNFVRTVGSIISVNSNDIPVQSDTIEVRYALPLEFGDTYSSRGYSNLDMNPLVNARWIQYRQRNSVVDGWGTLSLPFGTFSALRVVHEIQEVDSFYVDASGFAFWLPLELPLTREYEWWTNGKKDPLLKITTIDLGFGETVTAVDYQDIYLGFDAGITDVALQANVYPNPSSGIYSVSTNSEVTEFAIYSNDGRLLIQKEQESIGGFSVDLNGYPNGIYILELRNDAGASRIPLVKQ
jgi:hypothetical protein